MRLKNNNFFTMIELLVVIAIIAILASMLLPALKNAKNKAKSIACIGNFKQIALVDVQYTNDFNSYYMPRTMETTWYASEYVLANIDSPDGDNLGKWYKGMLCPESKSYLVAADGANSAASCYGMNDEQLRRSQYGQYRTKYVKMSKVRHPHARLRYADCMRNGQLRYNRRGEFIAENVYKSNPYGATAYRHPTQRVNVLFYDGHAENMSRVNFFKRGESFWLFWK